MALSGVVAESYSSSGAEHRARSGSVLFMVQYHREGSFRASTTPRKRLHWDYNMRVCAKEVSEMGYGIARLHGM